MMQILNERIFIFICSFYGSIKCIIAKPWSLYFGIYIKKNLLLRRCEKSHKDGFSSNAINNFKWLKIRNTVI